VGFTIQPMTNAAVMTKVFLWRIPARGGLARPVAFAGEDASAPSISRKGNQLAYRVSKERDAVWQLILKDERHASAPPTRILSANGFNGRPSFSPDGKKVVFESDRMGYSDIWVCDIVTTRHGCLMSPQTGVRIPKSSARNAKC
jgi:Tol biopolymer transport system component